MIGETAPKTIGVNVMGDDGIMACSRTKAHFGTDSYGRPEVRWPNGAKCAIGYASQPDSIRSLNLDLLVGDEIAFWKYFGMEDARDPMVAIEPALRQGIARMLLATTPNLLSLPAQYGLREIADRPTTIVHQVKSETNKWIKQSRLRALRRRWAGTTRARQELDGEIIIDTGLTMWTRENLDKWRVHDHPPLTLTVISVDPNKRAKVGNDPIGIVIVGFIGDHGYVLHGESAMLGPRELHTRLFDLALEYGATELLVEDNAVGDWWDAAMVGFGDLPLTLREVTAAEEKRSRALDAYGVFQQGYGHIVGHLPELEDELVRFTGVTATQRGHDDQVDALSQVFREYLLAPLEPSIYDFR